MDWRSLNGLVQGAVLGAFGEQSPAEYRIPGTVEPFPIQVIFDAEYVDVTVTDSPVESSGPAASTKASEFEQYDFQPKQNDEITINDVDYVVANVRPDGRGWIVLMLEAE